LCRYNGHTFTPVTAAEGLDASYIWCLLQDKCGTVWVGTAGNGLYASNGKSFYHYTGREGLWSKHVQSVLTDKHGKTWIGTSGGLFCFVGGNIVNVLKN
jgi:ligand-binding sensor domain-containing protein